MSIIKSAISKIRECRRSAYADNRGLELSNLSAADWGSKQSQRYARAANRIFRLVHGTRGRINA